MDRPPQTWSQRSERRTFDVLRFAGHIFSDDPPGALEQARNVMLDWLESKHVPITPAVRAGESFTAVDGRAFNVSRYRDQERDMWAFQMNDPDQEVARRAWVTEGTLAIGPDHRVFVGVRLLVTTPDDTPEIVPATPRLVRELASKFALYRDGTILAPDGERIKSYGDMEVLCEHLTDPARRLPVFVITSLHPEGWRAAINTRALARVTAGLARVVEVPPQFTRALTHRFGSARTTFDGAVRAYLPGFSAAADPFDHLYFHPHELLEDNGARAMAWLQITAADISLVTTRLQYDLVRFEDIHRVATEHQRRTVQDAAEARASQLAQLLHDMHERGERSERERQDATRSQGEQITQLRTELAEQERSFQEYRELTEAQLAEEREYAALLEKDEAATRARAEQLEEQLDNERQRRGRAEQATRSLQKQLNDRDARARENATTPQPETWSVFAEWAERHYGQRLRFTSRARSALRKTTYENLALASEAITWLATTYYDGRAERDIDISGFRSQDAGVWVENCPCGSDSYELRDGEVSLRIRYHLKHSSSRRLTEQLRIYYAWDEEAGEVVIDQMPEHVKNNFT
jgi:hypothetical protein